MRVILSYIIVCLLTACGAPSEQGNTTTQNNNTKSEAHGSAPQTTGVLGGTPFVLDGCYEMTMKRDTATLSLQVQDTIVSGKLRYDWQERDGNVGTLKGVLRDSLIIADYTFESEGLASVREVVFKIGDTALQQAFGDLEDRNGKIVFRNPAQLQYMQEYPFVKVDCPK